MKTGSILSPFRVDYETSNAFGDVIVTLTIEIEREKQKLGAFKLPAMPLSRREMENQVIGWCKKNYDNELTKLIEKLASEKNVNS